MAKILMTAIVADIRNKLNGSVFSKNRYGAYVRTKVTPVNPQTAFQAAARNILGGNAQAWRGLTEAQRIAWTAATANYPIVDIFGNTKILSGSALFTLLNGNLAQNGIARITAPPLPVALPALVIGAATIVGGTGVVTIPYTPTPVPAGFNVAVFATPNVPPGRSFVKNLFRKVTYLAAAAASPAVLTVQYAARFGAPVTGQKITVKLFMLNITTGQVGIPVVQTIIVS